MKVSATQKHARMSPRKIRPYGRMIQGMNAGVALAQLEFAPGKAPEILKQVLKSAVANAKNNLSIPETGLTVSSVLVNQGLVMKRFMPVSKGMAHSILKRTAHVTITVEGDAVEKPKKASAKKKNEIQTVSSEEFVALGAKEKKKQEAELSKQKDEKKALGEERAVDTVVDKKAGEAFQKMKMNQLGGDAKKSQKKTHRRKSIG